MGNEIQGQTIDSILKSIGFKKDKINNLVSYKKRVDGGVEIVDITPIEKRLRIYQICDDDPFYEKTLKNMVSEYSSTIIYIKKFYTING